ncbi:MAG TPA: rhomboid family intramembrane serine protease [Gemmatimonadaceae bacterium]|nr:rhomboid family intramembrane serine protease [Gemmatimonadaceae bacterium]
MPYQAASESEAPRFTPAVKTLIALNVAVLFLRATAFGNGIEHYLGFDWSAFVTSKHWWSVISYMFVHDSVLYLAVNMYALFIFGPRVEHSWGTKRFAEFYLICGIGALLCYLAFVHNSELLIGSSGAIFGVMTAYAMQWPNDEIFFFGIVPMRVWTMVMLFIGFNLAMGLYTSANGGPSSMMYFAHLGGALAGWFYVRTPDAPSLDQLRQRVSRVPDVEEPPRAIPRSQPRPRERADGVDEIVARSKAIASKRSVGAVPPNPAAGASGQSIDSVLDKISEQGLDSLTKDERRLLEEMSRRLRES